MKITSLIILMLTLSSNCFSAPASKETINELFEITETEKIIDSIYGQTNTLLKQMTQEMDISEENKPLFDEFFVEYNTLIKKKSPGKN